MHLRSSNAPLSAATVTSSLAGAAQQGTLILSPARGAAAQEVAASGSLDAAQQQQVGRPRTGAGQHMCTRAEQLTRIDQVGVVDLQQLQAGARGGSHTGGQALPPLAPRLACRQHEWRQHAPHPARCACPGGASPGGSASPAPPG